MIVRKTLAALAAVTAVTPSLDEQGAGAPSASDDMTILGIYF